jgi:5-methylthioadenosine/S-adenosylhomocysteine deaminase
MITAHKAQRIFGYGEDHAPGFLRVGAQGEIVEIAQSAQPGDQLIDHGKSALLPGGVNVHNHSFQSLLRGLGDDLPFLQWRARGLYKYAADLGPEAIHLGATLAFAEMLRSGTTTVCDFFYVHAGGLDNDRAVLRAADELGIRCVMARTMYDWDGAPASFQETVDEAVRRAQDLHDETSNAPLLSIQPAPHSLHGASADMIRAGVALAKDWDSPCHTHLAEESYQRDEALEQWGCGPAEYFARLGALNERSVLVHAIWLAGDELRAIAEAGASIAHCPASNMFLGDGVTPILDYLKQGLNVGLGTDGGCTNSRHSIYDECRSAVQLQKVHNTDGAAMTAETAFALGTEHGGRLLRLPVGRLSRGLQADFSVVDLTDMSLLPLHTLSKNIVHSMTDRAIIGSWVGGVERVRDGRVLGLDEEALVGRLNRLVMRWA